MAFMRLMSVGKLTGPELPSYPDGLSEEDAAWPVDDHSKQALLRFRWDQSETSRVNAEGLKRVLRWIEASGRSSLPKAREDLDDILEYDLAQRVELRWKYMKQEARKHQRAMAAKARTVGATGAAAVRSSSPIRDEDEEEEDDEPLGGVGGEGGTNGAGDGELVAADVVKEPTGTKRQTLISRAKGVSVVFVL